MFESLTLTTILLVLFFAYQNMKWGLTSTIPKDDDARLRYYCSECLTSLKNLLAGAKVQHIDKDSLILAENHQSLSLENGQLRLGQETLANLGPRGTINFERLSDTGLMVTIQAQEIEKFHRVNVRLEVKFLEPVVAN